MSDKAENLEELIEEWTFEGYKPVPTSSSDHSLQDKTFSNILDQLKFCSDRFYSRYIPALFPPHSPTYTDRLWKWLNNEGLTSDQQRLLFQFALRIVYISFEDFLQLYRCAYVNHVTRWIVDELQLKLTATGFTAQLDRERKRHTWYCPVTDSMVISEFYHANGISGIDQRPAFRSLYRFANPTSINNYMQEQGLKRLVLMEDFVGTGTQTLRIIEWALASFTCPILFAPMVMCPIGVPQFTALAHSSNNRFRFEPIITLDKTVFVASDVNISDTVLSGIADLARIIHSKIVMETPDPTGGALGFRHTGGIVVLFSNTPDNSLPLIHHHARAPSNWQALFPRVNREII